jgi:hypothetical protein
VEIVGTYNLDGTPQTTFSAGQSFMVNVTIHNTGEANALSVTASIDPGVNCALGEGEKVTKNIGLIEGRSQAEVGWILQCEGAGKSTITVTTAGVDENTGKAIVEANLEPDTFPVRQEGEAYLIVSSIAAMYKGSVQTVFSSEQEFEVNVIVSNIGESDAIDCNATIAIVGPASRAPGEPATKDTNPTTIIGITGTATVNWHLRCTGSGPVTITVTPAGTDENTGEPINYPDNVDEGQITITQVHKTHLVVDITAPEEDTIFFTGQEFVVKATVSNSGEAIAQDVSVTISIDAHSFLVPGETATKALGDISGGESVTVTWTLRCDKAGNSTITVNATGTDENTGEDILGANIVSASITVEQQSQLPWWYIPIILGILVFLAMVWLAFRALKKPA